jgi:hypothetical protein
MRNYQIFGSLSEEHALRLMRTLAEKSPGVFAQALAAASAALRARPVYLQRQPFEKRAAAVRRALARVASEPVAGELLAVYFLDCRKELLVEWLDALGLEHEEGILSADAPAQPPVAELRDTVAKFLAVDPDPDRRLLLAAFAAQAAIDWPELEALLATGADAPKG